MNDYIYRVMAEERQRQLNVVNWEAWKYRSISKPKFLAFKKLVKTKKPQKQVNVPCCA